MIVAKLTFSGNVFSNPGKLYCAEIIGADTKHTDNRDWSLPSVLPMLLGYTYNDKGDKMVLVKNRKRYYFSSYASGQL